MTKVVPIFDAPDGKPVDVVDGQVSGQLNLDVFALIPPQNFVASEFVGNFHAHDVGPRSVADPEVGVGPCTVVVQVGNVKCFGI